MNVKCVIKYDYINICLLEIYLYFGQEKCIHSFLFVASFNNLFECSSIIPFHS